MTKLSNGIAQLAKARNVQVIKGLATFDSPTQLSVKSENGTQTITFENCIIATGSRPTTIANIPTDLPCIINSTGALKLDDVPKRLLVIGGGYIGLEMGSVYNALGTQVSVAEFMPRLLPGADEDLVEPLARKLNKVFEEIYLSTKVAKVEPNGNEVNVHFEGTDGKEFSEIFDTVLVSIGRKPNTEKLGL